jgi:phosphohistidine phosphatase
MSTKTILLMRHSHAIADNPAWSDHERPLSRSGQELAQATAELLKAHRPDRILCSSALRTLQTSQIVADVLDNGLVPESHSSLYLAPADAYVAVARELLTAGNETVLFVGHNPGIASLMCDWAADALAVPPATVAIFRLRVADWSTLSSSADSIPQLSGFISGGIRVQ